MSALVAATVVGTRAKAPLLYALPRSTTTLPSTNRPVLVGGPAAQRKSWAMLRPSVTSSALGTRNLASASGAAGSIFLDRAKAAPTCSASASVFLSDWPLPPDITTALLNSPRASGDVLSMCTDMPPALSPMIVTLFGSPPNAVSSPGNGTCMQSCA